MTHKSNASTNRLTFAQEIEPEYAPRPSNRSGHSCAGTQKRRLSCAIRSSEQENLAALHPKVSASECREATEHDDQPFKVNDRVGCGVR
jgi:hypothetical protein